MSKTKLKTKEELLKSFIRANKVRRLVIANRAGFDTVEKYRAHLEEGIKNDEVTEDKKPLDMVIAFDTTGSMRSYIDSVKGHVVQTLEDIFNKSENDLRIKIIAFGDYCDMTSKNNFGRAYQESELSNDQNYLTDFVKEAENTYGGDADEFYELVLQKVIDETKWRKGSQKVLFLIGDCNPHEIGYCHRHFIQKNQIDWRVEAKRAAKKGIAIDTLSILGYNFYKELSEITNGVHLLFRNSENISNVIEGLTYARTSTKSFRSMASTADASGDEELIGAYKQMGELL